MDPIWQKSDIQSRLRPPIMRSASEASADIAAPRVQTAASTSTAAAAAACSTNVSQKINIENSILKPEAPEFVPAAKFASQNNAEKVAYNFNKMSMEDGGQSHGSGGRNSGNIGGAQARLLKHKSNTNRATDSDSYGNHNNPDMRRLEQIISSLIKYPGQFDDLLNVFLETINPYFEDFIIMSDVAKLLVNRAINHSNFYYNGARLCWFIEKFSPEFRAELHLNCKKLVEDPDQQKVVTFIAELYMQLPHDCLYGGLLIKSFEKLINSGKENDIKCVCQALKLTGYSLEQKNHAALNQLFVTLKALQHSMTGSVLMLLKSVINLKESNWGRTAEELNNAGQNTEPEIDNNGYEEMVNGILYESNGEALTTEENSFLASHATNDEYLFDNPEDDPDALCNPEPEMDEEIQLAFQEFVKMSNKERQTSHIK